MPGAGGSGGAGASGASSGSAGSDAGQGGSGDAGDGGSGDAGGDAGKGGSGNQGGTGDPAGSSGSSGQSTEGGSGGSIQVGGSGGTGGSVTPNECLSSCGGVELCDPEHLGFDDDCDGQADEDCTCVPGQAHWCFLGDPSNRFAGACQDGVERCTELGSWGPCTGGKHAIDGPNNCLTADLDCTDIKTAPFAKVKLSAGTTKFSKDADDGSESYAVTCPPGVTNCPGVSNPNKSTATFQPLQSGEYGVTYTKTVGGVPQSCTYSVFVGAGGLRVELSWDNLGLDTTSGASGPDLDLHLHRPNTLTPWGFLGGSADDCYQGNCRIEHFNGNEEPFGGKAISWFNDGGQGPLNWTKGSCVDVPISGGQWSALGMGCHNPRLDTDTFTCDASVTDPGSLGFCKPENINVDQVPDDAWFRVGVHYNTNCTPQETHPTVTVYCGGGQVARIGSELVNGQLQPAGFAAPFTFAPTDCGKKFWLAADIHVQQGECSLLCTVKPIYSNEATKAPYVVGPDSAEKNFGPAYPAAP